MIWATKCDQCGKYFNCQRDEVTGIMTFDTSRGKYSFRDDKYTYVLCPECLNKLYENNGTYFVTL